ncbi:MAG: right-handed parallel beta-helix repeat-containing protein [Anaerolineales bacterium]|nr:right-handed parallel beta-helix repeat-containing protein [Anaerolineales bacterium]
MPGYQPPEIPVPTPSPDRLPFPKPVFYVSVDGSDSNDGKTDNSAFATINMALQRAGDGDLIFVSSGAYEETIRIEKEIYLIGEDAETTIVSGANQGDVVSILSNNVTFSGFTVTNSGTNFISPFDGGDAGVKLEQVQNVQIMNIRVTDSTLGIFLNYAENNLLEGNTTYQNVYEGVYLRYSDHNLLQLNTSYENGGHGGYYIVNSSDNKIVSNNCANNPDHGIKLQQLSNNNLVEFNRCYGSKNAGIFLADAYFNIIRHNEFYENNTGAFIRLSDQNLVEENYFHDNENGVILDFASFENIIQNNHAADNWSGIDVKYSSNRNHILQNTLIANRGPGLWINRSSDNEIGQNIIMENGEGITITCGEEMHIAPEVENLTWDEFTRMEGYFAKFKDFVFEKGIMIEGKDNENNLITNNIIENNINWGMVTQIDVGEGACPVEINAANNWWGDPSGPFHPGVHPWGQGMVISDGIIFDPWLETRPGIP